MTPRLSAENTANLLRRKRRPSARYGSTGRSSQLAANAGQSDSEPTDSSAARIASAATNSKPESDMDIVRTGPAFPGSPTRLYDAAAGPADPIPGWSAFSVR